MHQDADENMFPTFNPRGWKFLTYQPRFKVHRDGDWHEGVQAYILREHSGILEVLIQKRSQKVDISGGKFDQSIAVQMIMADNLVPKATLKRGLKNELGLDLDTLERNEILTQVRLNIVKTYRQHPDKLNRERTHIFLIKVTNQEIVPNHDRVDEVLWIPWERMFSWKRSEPELFTKTSRFYAVDPVVSSEIEREVEHFFSEDKKSISENTKLPARITYYSESYAKNDVSIHEGNGHKRRTVYTLNGNEGGITIQQVITAKGN